MYATFNDGEQVQLRRALTAHVSELIAMAVATDGPSDAVVEAIIDTCTALRTLGGVLE